VSSYPRWVTLTIQSHFFFLSLSLFAILAFFCGYSKTYFSVVKKQDGNFSLTFLIYRTRLGRLPRRAVSHGANSRSIPSKRVTQFRRAADQSASLGLGVARSSWIFAIANSFRKMVSGDKNRRQTAYSPLQYEANSFAMRSSEGEFP